MVIRDQTARTPQAAHVRALDGLRGAAILAVVAFHTAVMATRGADWAGHRPPPLALWPLFAGKLGVDVFFVLSGFLVARSWQQARVRYDGSTPRAVLSFARRRARRIIPPYWASLVVLIPWRTPGWLSTTHGWWNIFLFASTNQFLNTELPHRVNVVTWSLTTEVHFYVLLPLLAFVLRRFGWTKLVVVLLAVSVVWRLMQGGTGGASEWIIGRADQFAAGMAAASVVAEHGRGRTSRVAAWLLRPRSGAVLALSAVAVAIPLGATQLLGKPLAFLATFHAVFAVVAAGALVRMLCRPQRTVLEQRWLGFLGAVSYSLYLWHWPLMMEASRRWGPSAPVLAGALAAAAVMTLMSYRFLERPFTRDRSGASQLTTRTSEDDALDRLVSTPR
jgi:peptidoglycan/LPS O-acetylase OafA/YrhL